MYLRNLYLHLRKVRAHRKWVRYYCFKLGLYWQGLTHDLSKYSPIELFESIKYYQGNRSPIDAAKETQGYSMAWFHHKGRNKHHYEYWQDNIDNNGGTNILMPYKYFAELVCDYLGAGRAYMGENFSYRAEYKWWRDKRAAPYAMNKTMQNMIEFIFDRLRIQEQIYEGDPARKSPETLINRAFPAASIMII